MNLSDVIYTNVKCLRNKIYFRGYDVNTGARIQDKFDFSPTLFIKTDKQTNYKSLDGRQMMPIHSDNIKEAKEFKDSQPSGTVYGNDAFEYCFIADNYKKAIEFDYTKVKIANVDIEVTSDEESGFPEPAKASQPITAIALSTNKKIIVFGNQDYKSKDPKVIYFKCEDEANLLHKFLQVWNTYDPDVFTGWNVLSFDIPYLINRITIVLGEDRAAEISPWRMIRSYTKKNMFNQEYQSYEIYGIEVLDYIELYKKVPHKNANAESYKLDFIAELELGEKKLDYSAYGSLSNLVNQNYELFIDYNIHDVKLVDRLEKKLSFLELYVTAAYDAKVNFTDVFQQTKMWDMLIYDYLREKNIVIPAKKDNNFTPFPGAWVKETLIGMYDWIVSIDLRSLYPFVQMQWNISPETLLPKEFKNFDIEKISAMPEIILQGRENKDICVAGSGHAFSKNIVGCMPDILERMYQDRKIYKDKMIEAEKLQELIVKELKRRNLYEKTE